MLYFDLGAAVVAQLEGQYLPPGTKVSGPGHAALITTGVYSLLASLTGFASILGPLHSRLRWSTIFFITQIINSIFALGIVLITVMSGSTSAQMFAALLPTVLFSVYMVIVVRSYRLSMKERLAGTLGSADMGAAAAGGSSQSSAGILAEGVSAVVDTGSIDSLAAASGAHTAKPSLRDMHTLGDDDDDLTVTAKDVEITVAGATSKAASADGRLAGGRGHGSSNGGVRTAGAGASNVIVALDDDDDDDNDLARGSGIGRRV